MRIDSSPVYLDTSALAKLYVTEPDSDALEKAIIGRRDLFASDLALTELCSALARRVRQGDLPARDGERVYRRAALDFEAGVFRRAEISRAVHREAERLLLSIGRHVLAVVVGALALVTFDVRWRAIRSA